VPAELAGPLDRAVRTLYGVSWGQARAWITSGKVRVGDAVATDPTRRVAADVTLHFDERARRVSPRGAAGELTDDQVVHLDTHLLVLSKPAGISTIPYDDSDKDTLEARARAWLERRARGAKERGGGGGRRGGRVALGVVHRIDKETSGLIVFTRTWAAKASLSLQFRHHTVHRRYLAIAHGQVQTGTLRSFLVENRGDGLRGSARGTPPADSREAITHIERLEQLHGATLLSCRLETGRTHQIRIHLSEAGHPLVGERVYVRGWKGVPIEAPRLMLHAAELGFVHPATEREMRWQLPMPDDMRTVVDQLRS
jgi:23S rRNA pseudouridine1911/1915/1917 synthase